MLCVDEKSQIQALDRTQPGLPLKKGRAQTMTHDYKRNGTTTLFAALDVKTGQVIGECRARHRAKEFIISLKKIDTAVDKVARFAPHPRQLLDTQDKAGAELAEAAQALQTALHSDLFVLAQFGRAVLRLDYRGRHPPWRLQERGRT